MPKFKITLGYTKLTDYEATVEIEAEDEDNISNKIFLNSNELSKLNFKEVKIQDDPSDYDVVRIDNT